MTWVSSAADGTITAPASYAQQRVWLSEQIDGTAERYNIQAGARFRGELDRRALTEALRALMRHQAVLRTSLTMENGEILQVIAPPGNPALRFVDLSATPGPEIELDRLARADVEAPFDPSEGPFIRLTLYKLAKDDHTLIITMDHLMADPWSVGILHDLLARFYAWRMDDANEPPEPPIQYADYALWQHELLDTGALDDQLTYWRGQLASDPPRLALPTVRAHRTRTAACASRPVSDDLVSALNALGQATGSSLFMTLFAGFSVLLGRYASQEDVLIGTLMTGRTRPETEQLIGFFANVGVLRTDLSGQPSFLELLRRVKEVTLNAFANQDVPFQRVVSELKPRRDSADQPFSNALFQLADLQRDPVETPETRIEAYRAASQPTPADLAVTVMQENDGMVVVCDYDTGLFDESTVIRMLDHYLLVLEAMTTAPNSPISEPVLLTDADRRWLGALETPGPSIRADWNLGVWFQDLAARYASTTAIDTGATSLTYRELDHMANQVAHNLRARGVGPGSLVGVLLERGVDLVKCVLGVLKAGAAYIPLDPAYPAERLRHMIEDASPAWIIGTDVPGDLITSATGLILTKELTGRSPTAPPSTAAADDLAYVIYTSGSTGRPKGAGVCHRGLGVTSAAQVEITRLSPRDRVLQMASPSFDASVYEMLWAFGAGATLCVPTSRAVSYGDLAALVRTHRATALITPPSVLSAVPDDVELPELRTVVAAGEACPPQLAARWSRGRVFHNGYGPTEASIWATSHRVGGDDLDDAIVPIGRPIPGVSVDVLDEQGRHVPIGRAGELVVGGPTVGQGYLGQPALTAERFVPHVRGGRPGGRSYRTGDLVRWRSDGVLEFLGRIDRQVKLRGFRIELGEIEARLAAHPAVRDALVMIREDAEHHSLLTAYVVLVHASTTTPSQLREHCAVRLPAYMVPSAVVPLERFPLTPNGKLDTNALPAPPPMADVEEYVAPDTLAEEAIGLIWSELLGQDRVSATANFFELGGDSLTATRVAARIRRDFRVDVSARMLFDHPTLRELSAAIGVLTADDGGD